MDKLQKIIKTHAISKDLADDLRLLWNQQFSSEITFQELSSPQGSAKEIDQTYVDQPTISVPLDTQTVRLTSSQNQFIDTYERLGLLGKGGMGLVLRVFDKNLKRSLALKLLNSELCKDNVSCLRFIEEAQICAQLQHPNIVPIYSMGMQDENQLYFTMREVEGFHLGTVITELHNSIIDGNWTKTKRGWSFRQAIEILIQVSKTIAFAHQKGVIHRDIKPSNIMLGEFGEVLVIDWGIAKLMKKEEKTIQTSRSEQRTFDTLMGEISGTPAYMSPEQAQGDVDLQGPHSDIYSLGCILYEILSGSPPYIGNTAQAIIQRVISSPPSPLKPTNSEDFLGFERFEQSNERLPEELKNICEKAMARSITKRYDSALAFANALEDWLTGQKNRKEALALVQRAQELQEKIFIQKEEAYILLKNATAGLSWIPENASEKEKSTHWELEDKGKELLEQANLKELERELLLHGALSHKPDLLEAHQELASEYQKRHMKCEKENQRAIQWEQKLRYHLTFLSKRQKLGYASYLKGDGLLSLESSNSRSEFWLYPYTSKNRRLQTDKGSFIGTHRLEKLSIAMGSYLIVIKTPENASVRYPIYISRKKHLYVSSDIQKPLEPIFIPKEIPKTLCYIPGGWFQLGGDSIALHAPPAKSIWLDAFFMQKHPVTNRAYLVFLNDLLTQGREEEAEQYCPQEAGGLHLYDYSLDGFQLKPDKEGDQWELDWPVMMVSFESANAYAHWLSKKESQKWRLPTEEEWEKSAKGADLRSYPWGEHFDPSWACMRSSRAKILPCSIYDFPIDESPFGVSGMAGNMIDWTQTFDEEQKHVVYKGGAWSTAPQNLRIARRGYSPPQARRNYLGFRLVYQQNQETLVCNS